MPALSDEDLIDILETEGFRHLELEFDPSKEVVLGRRVRLLDHDWPLTLRVYTGIFRDPETEEEVRAYNMVVKDSPIHRFYERGHIRIVLVWRTDHGSIIGIATLPRVELAGENAEEQLRERLRTWMNYAPLACPHCGAPMHKRKPKYQSEWEWACLMCEATTPIEQAATG